MSKARVAAFEAALTDRVHLGADNYGPVVGRTTRAMGDGRTLQQNLPETVRNLPPRAPAVDEIRQVWTGLRRNLLAPDQTFSRVRNLNEVCG